MSYRYNTESHLPVFPNTGILPALIPEDLGCSKEARADGRIRGLWYRGVNSFFDVIIVNTSASTYVGVEISHSLQQREDRKKDKYSYRIMNYDYGTFIPLIFAASGARGTEAEQFMKLLASKISRKKKEEYSKVASLLSIRLSFAIQRAAVLCIRGSHVRCIQNYANENDRAEIFANVPADVLLVDNAFPD